MIDTARMREIREIVFPDSVVPVVVELIDEVTRLRDVAVDLGKATTGASLDLATQINGIIKDELGIE